MNSSYGSSKTEPYKIHIKAMHHSCYLKIVQEIKELCAENITFSSKEATRFFKISEGDYAASDKFLGVPVPSLRKIAKIYQDIDLQALDLLLQSPYNEERLLALLILIIQYQKSNSDTQKALYHFYLDHLDAVNNWNLVDASAHHILGHYLWDKDKAQLLQLSSSENLWKRRVSIISTWYFIRNLELDWTFRIAQHLLSDPQDLIHKAVGWMLREAGKKDEKKLLSFLSAHAQSMPKTMFRYAIERLSADQKKAIFMR